MRIPLLLTLVSIIGCNRTSGTDTDLAEESTDSALTGQDEASVLATLVEGTQAATPTATAQAITSQLGSKLQPAGCATATTSGATTTVQIAGCTGPRGLVQLDGTIVVTITAVTLTSISFTASSTDFQVGGGALDLALTGTYHDVAGTRSVTVSSMTTGTGPRGHEITHTGDYTASWDGACATVDGAWATAGEVGTRSLDVAMTRCTTGCPRGTVRRTGVAGRSLEITFDGSAVATWTSSARTGTIPLACTP